MTKANTTTANTGLNENKKAQSTLLLHTGVRSLTHGFLQIFLPIALISAALISGYVYFQYQTELNTLKKGEELRLKLAKNAAKRQFHIATGELHYLTNSGLLDLWLNAGDMERPEIKTRIERDWVQLSQSKHLYDQVRFIDSSGKEAIRVNFNNGFPAPVADTGLQDKSDRYYFQDSIKLSDNELFVSPLDLNMEKGEVERPFKPMIRIGSPVIDEGGDKRGIVLFNYFSERLITTVRSTLEGYTSTPMMLNRDGFWLLGPHQEDEWGFMLDNNRSFANRYAAEWPYINSKDHGELSTSNGIFIFTTIYPLAKSDRHKSMVTGVDPSSYRWIILSHLSKSSLDTLFGNMVKNGTYIYLSFLLVFIPISFFLARTRMRHQVAVNDLQQSHNSQRTLIEKLQEAQNCLIQQEKMSSIERLAAGISQDLSNPVSHIGSSLRTLSGYISELLVMLDAYADSDTVIQEHPDLNKRINELKQSLDIGFLQTDSTAMINEIDNSLKKIRRIIQDLNDFSSADTQEFVPVDIHRVIDNTINILWSKLRDKVEVVRDFSTIPEVICIPSQISQVFINLLLNAIDSIDEYGSIHIHTWSENGKVWVNIKDSGTGIEPENLTHLFEPFFTTRSDENRSGLGLSVAYGIIKNHGGTIEAKSTLGEGSSFRICLPIDKTILFTKSNI